MRIHYLQHLPFEDSAGIAGWAAVHGHSESRTRFFRGEPLPALYDVDWLIVLGGAMSVNEESRYPWLVSEKKFLKEAIAAGKTLIGICLGAQLLADVLGGQVYKNTYPEIGWHPVSLTDAGIASPLFKGFPARVEAFHWHGDTFTIPPGCTHLASSEACVNQAFATSDNRVIGLQYHLETVRTSITSLVHNCPEDLVDSPYVQSGEDMLSRPERLTELDTILRRFLDNVSG